MRTLPWLLAAMLIAAPALTGCIGGGDDGGAADEPGNDTNRTDDGDDGSGNASDDGNTSDDDGFGEGDDEDEASWQSENRTGTVSPTSQVTGEGQTETFTVDGAESLMLNLSADGGELNMCIMKPSEGSSGNSSGSAVGAQQEECSETATTQDGNASYQASSPADGEWTVKLTAAQGTTGEVEYTLTIAQLVSGGSGSTSSSTYAIAR